MPEAYPFVQHDRTATFESFVRPVVVPVFRPRQALPIPPLPDPEQGRAVITGSSGEAIVLTKSEQSSWSRSMPVEIRRKVTRQRVYQKKDDGTIERENFVDVEHTTEMEMREGDGTLRHEYYADPPEAPNIETIEANVTITNPEAPAEGGGAAP